MYNEMRPDDAYHLPTWGKAAMKMERTFRRRLRRRLRSERRAVAKVEQYGLMAVLSDRDVEVLIERTVPAFAAFTFGERF